MSSVSGTGKKLPLAKLALAAVAALVVGALLLREMDLNALLDRGMALIRGAGPGAFFTAMAVTPAFGMPVLAFDLTAGPVFGERLGMPWVVALALAALALNMILSYILARRALRPALTFLLARLGYKLPHVGSGDATDLTIILRITPGPPFCVQNYLLGLAEVPFSKYLLISCLVSWPSNAAIILFGDSLRHGHAAAAITTGSLVVAVAAATHLLRRHYGRKKAAA